MLTTTRWQLARLLPSRQQAGILVKMLLLSRLTARGMLSTRLSTGKRALPCSLARSLAQFPSKQLTSMRDEGSAESRIGLENAGQRTGRSTPAWPDQL